MHPIAEHMVPRFVERPDVCVVHNTVLVDLEPQVLLQGRPLVPRSITAHIVGIEDALVRVRVKELAVATVDEDGTSSQRGLLDACEDVLTGCGARLRTYENMEHDGHWT